MEGSDSGDDAVDDDRDVDSDEAVDDSPDISSDGAVDESPDTAADGDTFGVGIAVTESEFQFVVHVPSDIDAGWTDPHAFQRLVEEAVWDRLDREATLREIGKTADVGETVTLGRVTLLPDGTVVDTTFNEGVAES